MPATCYACGVPGSAFTRSLLRCGQIIHLFKRIDRTRGRHTRGIQGHAVRVFGADRARHIGPVATIGLSCKEKYVFFFFKSALIGAKAKRARLCAVDPGPNDVSGAV